MPKKLTGKALARFEARRDVWQEVLGGVREIKAGGGHRVPLALSAIPAGPLPVAALEVRPARQNPGRARPKPLAQQTP